MLECIKVNKNIYRINLGDTCFEGNTKKEAEEQTTNILNWYFNNSNENIIQYLNENENIIQLATLTKNINGYIMEILLKNKNDNKQEKRAYYNIGYIEYKEAIKNFVNYCNEYKNLLQENI